MSGSASPRRCRRFLGNIPCGGPLDPWAETGLPRKAQEPLPAGGGKTLPGDSRHDCPHDKRHLARVAHHEPVGRELPAMVTLDHHDVDRKFRQEPEGGPRGEEHPSLRVEEHRVGPACPEAVGVLPRKIDRMVRVLERGYPEPCPGEPADDLFQDLRLAGSALPHHLYDQRHGKPDNGRPRKV